MSARRSAVVRIVALCLLASPAVALGQDGGPAQPQRDARTSYRPNRSDRALTRVIIYGSIGAIVGALSTLRKRNGADAVSGDDEITRP